MAGVAQMEAVHSSKVSEHIILRGLSVLFGNESRDVPKIYIFFVRFL
jgi:hypothetical protein